MINVRESKNLALLTKGRRKDFVSSSSLVFGETQNQVSIEAPNLTEFGETLVRKRKSKYFERDGESSRTFCDPRTIFEHRYLQKTLVSQNNGINKRISDMRHNTL